MTRIQLFALYIEHYQPSFLKTRSNCTLFCEGRMCMDCKIKITCPQTGMGCLDVEMLELQRLYPEYFI